MGKGDRRTFRGKINVSSYGNTRKHKNPSPSDRFRVVRAKKEAPSAEMVAKLSRAVAKASTAKPKSTSDARVTTRVRIAKSEKPEGTKRSNASGSKSAEKAPVKTEKKPTKKTPTNAA